MKQELLNRVKKEIYPVIDSMTIENMDEKQKMIQTYFDFMKSLKVLPEIDTGISNIVAVKEPEVSMEKPKAKEYKAEVPGVKSYVFERKLRGGVILGLEGNYLIPEKLVRDMGVEHGDRVVVSNNNITIRGETRYRFEIVEKANAGNAPGREQIDQCIVEVNKQGISYIIKNTSNGPIDILGEPFTFVIARKDVMDFNIKTGDIVDIAYYENNTDTMKIIQKHDISEMPQPTSIVKKPVLKKEEEEDKEVRQFPIDMELMKDKNILIVGSEYEKIKYQQAFSMIGMNLTHMSGDEGKVRLRTAIRKSDVVVVTTMHVGHKGSVPTADLCKEYDVPLAAVDKNGVQYILIEAEKVMKRKLEQGATA